MDFPLDVLDRTVVPVLGGTVIALDHSVGINTVLAINLSSDWVCGTFCKHLMPVKCYGNQIHSSARAKNNGNQSSITFESFQECLCDVAAP